MMLATAVCSMLPADSPELPVVLTLEFETLLEFMATASDPATAVVAVVAVGAVIPASVAPLEFVAAPVATPPLLSLAPGSASPPLDATAPSLAGSARETTSVIS
jgi:hypothetical protein